MGDDPFLSNLVHPGAWVYFPDHSQVFPEALLQMARYPEGKIILEHLITRYVLSQVPISLNGFDAGRFVGKQELVKDLIHTVQATIAAHQQQGGAHVVDEAV